MLLGGTYISNTNQYYQFILNFRTALGNVDFFKSYDYGINPTIFSEFKYMDYYFDSDHSLTSHFVYSCSERTDGSM